MVKKKDEMVFVCFVENFFGTNNKKWRITRKSEKSVIMQIKIGIDEQIMTAFREAQSLIQNDGFEKKEAFLSSTIN